MNMINFYQRMSNEQKNIVAIMFDTRNKATSFGDLKFCATANFGKLSVIYISEG